MLHHTSHPCAPQDIDLFFEKAKNQGMTFEGEEKSISRLLNDTSLDKAQFKLLPSVEVSLASDLLNSTVAADNAASRSKNELNQTNSNSKDEIQRIRDEVQQIDAYQKLDAIRDVGGCKEEQLLMDLRFDTSREVTSVNSSSRRAMSRLNLEAQELEMQSSESRVYKVDKNGEKVDDPSAVHVISRNLTSNSFYNQQNFYSDRSQAMPQNEQFTFQPSTSERQKQLALQAQPRNPQTNKSTNQDYKALALLEEGKNIDEVQLDLADLKNGCQVSLASAQRSEKGDSSVAQTVKSQLDTWQETKSPKTQPTTHDRPPHYKNFKGDGKDLHISITSQNNSLQIEARFSSTMERRNGKPKPPTTSARRLKPVQYLSNQQTYFEKVRQRKHGKHQAKPSTKSATLNAPAKQLFNKLDPVAESPTKPHDHALVSEVQQFNDVFLEDFEEEEDMDEGCCGTYETCRESKHAHEERSLARRLLKSPEPNLPYYFSSVNAEPAAEQAAPELPFDSRVASPAAEVLLDSDKPEATASPFKQFSTEANGLKKHRIVRDAANPIVNLEVSKDIVDDYPNKAKNAELVQEAPRKSVTHVEKEAEPLHLMEGEAPAGASREDQRSNGERKQTSCGRVIEMESKEANELIKEVRRTLKERPRMFQQTPKHPLKLSSTTKVLGKPKTRNTKLYSPMRKGETERSAKRSDGSPARQFQAVTSHTVCRTLKDLKMCTNSQSSSTNLRTAKITAAPQKKPILKAKSPASSKIRDKSERPKQQTTCPAERHPDRLFSPVVTVTLDEICERVQLLQDRFIEPKNVIQECKETIQNQMQVIIALLEQQIKYGIDKVSLKDEITNKKFDLDATMNLLSRLEIQQDKDRKLLGHMHPDLEEPKLLTMKYEIIDKERLSWIRQQNEELEEKIKNLETKLRIYKRNEKYQFWGYYDIVAENNKRDCNSFDRSQPKSTLMDFKSPGTERRNFKISRNHNEYNQLKENNSSTLRPPSQGSTHGPPSVSRSNLGNSLMSPNSRSNLNIAKHSKMPIPLISNKKGNIPQADVNAVNKKLRELQKEIFVKERQLKESKLQEDEMKVQLKKEKQQRQIESMEKELKIQFLQNQMDQIYSVYQRRMKNTEPSTKSMKTLGQRLLAEISEHPDLKGICGKKKEEPLMQLTATLLQKNHDLEQQIFALERKNDELIGLTGDDNRASDSQNEQQDKIKEMQECIQLLSNIFVQQKENEASPSPQKQKVVASSNHVKEPSAVSRKYSTTQHHRKQSSLTKEEEDFQRLLRTSITVSSVSSQQRPECSGKAGKERTALGSFLHNSRHHQKPTRSSNGPVVSQRKGSNDFSHIKLIPQLFNESDTMNSRHDTQRSRDSRGAADRGLGARQATLADMILPKSKLNPAKAQPKRQGATKRPKQDLSDLKVFRQSQKCSNNNAMKYQVYPARPNDQEQVGLGGHDMRSSNESLKRIMRQGQKKSKYVILPHQVKRSAVRDAAGKAESPAQLQESADDVHSLKFTSTQMAQEAPLKIALPDRMTSRKETKCQKERCKTRVNSQQMNKLRYLFH